MPYRATLPMYDWPEIRGETDARWAAMREALRMEGFEAPEELERPDDPSDLWSSSDLLLGETCTWPLASALAGQVRYVATPIHDAAGCGWGTYRSAVVRRGAGDADLPPHGGAMIATDVLEGRMAANSEDSLSGWIAFNRDTDANGLDRDHLSEPLWTGSHRASIQAVAAGDADFAAIDCVTWAIARDHEPAAAKLRVAGWTANRPALPLITAIRFTDLELRRIRRAVLSAIDAIVMENPVKF